MKKEARQEKELIQMDTRYELSECMQHHVRVIHVTEWLNISSQEAIRFCAFVTHLCVAYRPERHAQAHLTWSA